MLAKVEKKGKKKAVVFNLWFLVKEVVFFGVVVGLGLFAGYEVFRQGMAPDLAEVQLGILDFVIGFGVAVVVLFLLLRFVKRATVFQVFFAILIFAGAQIFFSVWISDVFALMLAVALVLWRFVWPTVFSQNVAIVLSVVGIGIAFGISLDIITVLILLTLFSIYDIIAVLKTGHMQKMFRQLFAQGAIFSILIPQKAGTWCASLKRLGVGAKHGVLVLGTGDLVFPIIFAVAALRISLPVALGVAVGSVAGIVLLHILFVIARRPMALPALPPIFAGSFVGFLIMYLLV